jgi:hypothetical protein
MTSFNKPDDFILAIVEFADRDAHSVHYVRRPFHDKGITSEFAGATVNFPLASNHDAIHVPIAKGGIGCARAVSRLRKQPEQFLCCT